MMKGRRPLSGAQCGVPYLEPRQCDSFVDPISNNGGKANAAGQQNTERAVLSVIQRATAA
jgi:hypothetical protein